MSTQEKIATFIVGFLTIVGLCSYVYLLFRQLRKARRKDTLRREINEKFQRDVDAAVAYLKSPRHNGRPTAQAPERD